MDINEMSSAAIIVPHIHEHLSIGLNALKDRFLLEDAEYNSSLAEPPSPLFQFTEIPEIADYQEIVATSPQAPSHDTHIQMDDSDLYENDLFSFVLDGNDSTDSQSTNLKESDIKHSLTTAFEKQVVKHSTSVTNLELPMDLLDLLDVTSACSNLLQDCASPESSISPELMTIRTTKSNTSEYSSSSNPSVHVNFDQMGDFASSEEEDYDSQEDDYTDQFNGLKYYNSVNIKMKKKSAVSVSLHNEDLLCGKPGQRLQLTNEEKRLLIQMGVQVPTKFPLSRGEERSIRTMRRKIRNKLSAKASRTRRQEYLSTLENRVSTCHKENHKLRTRITELEKDKQGLMSNMRQMRSYLARLLSGVPGSLTKQQHQPPLLPLTISSQSKEQFMSVLRKESKSARTGGTSLLLVAFMILASAAVLPLPDFNTTASSAVGQIHSKSLLLDTDSLPSAAMDQSIPGRSRVLLNNVKPEVPDDAAVDVSSLSPPKEGKKMKPQLLPKEMTSVLKKVDCNKAATVKQWNTEIKYGPDNQPDPFLSNFMEDL